MAHSGQQEFELTHSNLRLKQLFGRPALELGQRNLQPSLQFFPCAESLERTRINAR